MDDRALARGALAGLGAGILASLAMNQFQSWVSKLSSPSGGGGDPTTVKAAEKVVGPLRQSAKPKAGNAVHYLFGSAVGLVYGAAAETEPWVTSGFGLPYGGAVALVADEALVPAAGLSGPPWDSPLSTHAYSLASHLVFGAALEAGRRLLLRVI